MKVLVSLCKLGPILFILVKLKIIELEKKIFLNEIEQGNEVYIPNDLNLD